MKAKKKKKKANRFILTATIIVVLLSAGLFGLLALQYFSDEPPPHSIEEFSINFYFHNALTNAWEYETRSIEFNNNTAVIENILNELTEGPLSANLSPSIISGIEIIDFRIIEDYNRLEIVFSEDIYLLEGLYIAFAVTSIVHTLTELDFINSVLFFAGDSELLRPDGLPVGEMGQGEVLTYIPDDPINTMPLEIALYFSDSESMYLQFESRIVNINPILMADGIEPYASILDALIEGPALANLYGTIPENIIFNRIERNNDILTIDFGTEFANIRLGTTGEVLLFGSIVNSFTEIPEILGVQFLIDGIHIQDVNHGFHLDFSAPMERMEYLIGN